jgi:nitroreductase
MEFKDVIEKRAAYRALEPIEISDDFIKEIAYQASRAPSCANTQPWRFLFVKDKEVLKQLHEALSGGNYWAKNASMLIAVHSNVEYGCVVSSREYYLFGSGMASLQLMLSIVDKGLVAHAMAGFNEELAKEVLGIPSDDTLITIIAVGKKSEDLSMLGDKHKEVEQRRSIRKPFEDFAKIDTF